MVVLGYNPFPLAALSVWARRLILPAFLGVAVYAASQASRVAGVAAFAGALLFYVRGLPGAAAPRARRLRARGLRRAPSCTTA